MQHTARHERLDTLCGDEFQGFRGVPCGRDDCELNVLHNSSRLIPGAIQLQLPHSMQGCRKTVHWKITFLAAHVLRHSYLYVM